MIRIRRRIFTPKRIAIGVGVGSLVVLALYFYNVGIFSTLLSREQGGQIAAQEEKIADLEKKIKQAEQDKNTALLRAREADGRFNAAMAAVSEERRKVQVWIAKYAAIKSTRIEVVNSADDARRIAKEMGWSR